MNSRKDETTHKGKTISADQARNAKPGLHTEGDLAREKARYSYELAHSERGLLGKFLGSETEKPGNVAFIVIILSFIFIISLLFTIDLKENGDFFLQVITIALGIVGTSLGYLFGSSDRK